jgi:hypothetical protein
MKEESFGGTLSNSRGSRYQRSRPRCSTATLSAFQILGISPHICVCSNSSVVSVSVFRARKRAPNY